MDYEINPATQDWGQKDLKRGVKNLEEFRMKKFER
jgi:hypothetical protein